MKRKPDIYVRHDPHGRMVATLSCFTRPKGKGWTKADLRRTGQQGQARIGGGKYVAGQSDR